MGQWLGIDHGTKRIGVAVGSTSEGIASPVTIVPGQPFEAAAMQIAELAEKYGAEGMVVGWPLNMDGTEGPQGRLARSRAQELAQLTGLDVRLWDERLSSFVADQALAGAFTRKGKKARQDAVAAAVILQAFLAAGGRDSAPAPDEIDV